jgi:5-methylcytosine-specific restriction endonuclease McrA
MYHPDLIRHPDGCPALVLNADYTPLSYYPLSLWPWQNAIKAVFLDRVDIVDVKPSQYPAFTRFNLFLRDSFACQYCGCPRDLTFDHVVPRAQGGRTTWENVATACSPCNLKKGGRTPKQAHMNLHLAPIRPTSWQLQDQGRRFPPNYLHTSWRDWLYWDVELEA